MDAQMATGIPTFSVSLTPHKFHESAIHHDFFFDHFLKKGAEAAHAVRLMADLKL
jgi:6,7-dimethyl-8-ribityllumazine synthase